MDFKNNFFHCCSKISDQGCLMATDLLTDNEKLELNTRHAYDRRIEKLEQENKEISRKLAGILWI